MTSPARALAAASAAAAAMVLAGCSLAPDVPEQIPPAPGTPRGANQGAIGDSIRLSGDQTAIRVGVLRVLDPLAVGPGDKTLEKRARFVGVEVELKNVGEAVYDETPLAGATLVTADGAEIDGEIVLGGPCAGRFPSNLRVPPGRSRKDCMVFELGAAEVPARFTFRLNSGFGDEVGEWTLG